MSSLQADKGNLWEKTKKSEFNYIIFTIIASDAQAELGRDWQGRRPSFVFPARATGTQQDRSMVQNKKAT